MASKRICRAFHYNVNGKNVIIFAYEENQADILISGYCEFHNLLNAHVRLEWALQQTFGSLQKLVREQYYYYHLKRR